MVEEAKGGRNHGGEAGNHRSLHGGGGEDWENPLRKRWSLGESIESEVEFGRIH